MKWVAITLLAATLAGFQLRAEQNGETVDLTAKPLVVDPKIKALVDQLGAPDTVQREDAEKTLSGMGKAAAPALKEAEKSANPEIVARAKRIGARLADTAARPRSYADVLPADSVFFLEFNDTAATVERMKTTPLGKLWDKPSTTALLNGYRGGLINTELKIYDAANAMPKLANGKAVVALGGPDTIEAHEIDPPLLFVLETKNLPAVEAQARILFEGMNDAPRTKRQYKNFQLEEQTSACTFFGQDRAIHSLTAKGIETFLDNLTAPPAKLLSALLADLKTKRPNADVHIRVAADGLKTLAEANQLLDDEQVQMLETAGFAEGSFFESAMTLNAEGVEEFSRLSLSGAAKNKGLLAVLQRMALKPAQPTAANQPQALDLIPFQAAVVAGFSGDVSAHAGELSAALRSLDALTGTPLHPDPTLHAPAVQPVKPTPPNAPVQPPRPPTQGTSRAEDALKLGGGDIGAQEKETAPAMKAKGPAAGKKAAKPAEPERSTPHLDRLAKAGLTLDLLFGQCDGPMYVALFPERIDIRKLANPNAPNNPEDPDHIPMAALFAMVLKDPEPVALALQKANVGLQPRFTKKLMNGGDFYAEDEDDDNSGGFWMSKNYFAYATSKDILELASAATLNAKGIERMASRKAYIDYLTTGYDAGALLNVFADSRQFLEMPYNMARLQWDTNAQAPWPDFSIAAGLLKGNVMRIKIKQVNGALQIEAQTPLSIFGMIEALRRPLTEAGLVQ